MKVLKFRIKNYKSIWDSGDCYLDNFITILAGKNESGKTAILEALEDFNNGKNIRDDAVPIQNKSAIPEVMVTIKLEKNEIDYMNEILNIKIKQKVLELDIFKSYPNSYQIDLDSLVSGIPSFQHLFNLKTKMRKLIITIKKDIEDFPIAEDPIEEPQQILDLLAAYNLPDISYLNERKQRQIRSNIEELKKVITDIINISSFKQQICDFIIQNSIPNFILFKTFDDILPNQTPISNAESIQIIKDLSTLCDLDFATIQPSTDPREREKHKDRVNLKFSDEYRIFWTQDHSNLYISWDSNNIYFWIKENEEYYKPEIRSKGRQWHLSFYIRVTARTLEGKYNVVLIDEPGLFIHAKAQKDILQKLEACAKRCKIIYSTHSPYLIPSVNLNRVRLVIKTNNQIGTKIIKVTAKADKETLTPIITAIGEDLSGGIRVDKKNSVVLEGFCDYLWLDAFKQLLNTKDINFVPSVGAGNVPSVGAILFGWGLDPIFILDNDKNGRAARTKLIRQLSIEEERIIMIPHDKDGCIEDLFSNDDYKKYVTKGYSVKSKTIIATEFNQKIDGGEITLADISQETKGNYKNLFESIEILIT